MSNPLGKIVKVDLRTAWKNEASDFSDWLCDNENLALLSEEIGIDISLIKKEAEVGKFSLDILAEEEATGRKIIIENQLETTDHDHLGKIITYAAGYDANIIIWIFKEIREEHRQAIDWLNENTPEKIAFFAIKLELWQIDNSAPAPKFQVISSPNEWSKILKQGNIKDELTDTKLRQFDFWTRLKSYAQEQKLPIKFQTPRYQHWYDVSIGNSVAHIMLTINTREQLLACGIYISNDKGLFNYLQEQKAQLENELGGLEWKEAAKACLITQKLTGADIEKESKMNEYFKWLTDKIVLFRTHFSKLIKEYKQQ